MDGTVDTQQTKSVDTLQIDWFIDAFGSTVTVPNTGKVNGASRAGQKKSGENGSAHGFGWALKEPAGL